MLKIEMWIEFQWNKRWRECQLLIWIVINHLFHRCINSIKSMSHEVIIVFIKDYTIILITLADNHNHTRGMFYIMLKVMKVELVRIRLLIESQEINFNMFLFYALRFWNGRVSISSSLWKVTSSIITWLCVKYKRNVHWRLGIRKRVQCRILYLLNHVGYFRYLNAYKPEAFYNIKENIPINLIHCHASDWLSHLLKVWHSLCNTPFAVKVVCFFCIIILYNYTSFLLLILFMVLEGWKHSIEMSKLSSV